MSLDGTRLVPRTVSRVKTLAARFAPARLQSRSRDFYCGLKFAGALFRPTITSANAMSAVRSRLDGRVDAFLSTVEREIFAYPESPYRPLLAAAGYDLTRIRGLVNEDGLEGTLRRLARDGVYVTIDEYKGLREARRGAQSFRWTPADFSNPLAGPGMRVSSGGTRSRGIPTSATTEVFRLSAEHFSVMLAAHGLEGLPVAVWFTRSQGAGMGVVLCFAMTGNAPARWFKDLPDRYGNAEESYSYFLGLKAGARLHGLTLPPDMYVPVGEEAAILSWAVREAGRRGCAIFTTPSRALRLALAAKRTNTSLARVTFLVGSEPLTPAKLAAVQAVGARAFSMFGSVEVGGAAYGCVSPASPDEMHICRDAVAVIQHRRVVDRSGSEVDALLFTGLRPDAGRVLLNMESGDYARMTTRRCGCPLEALGWSEHLEEVRSFEKLTPEGGTFFGTKLIALFEELLPARFGGDPSDYQLLEHEDGEGFTRLTVLVHPRLGVVDEDAILDYVQRTLEPETDVASVFTQLGTLRLSRTAPMMTGAGKMMTLHRPQANQAIDAQPVS